MKPFAAFSFAAIAVCLSLLDGCGLSPSRPAGVAVPAGMTGVVHGGQQPVVGAAIQLYAVGTAGDGSAATPLLTLPVFSGAGGGFTITDGYSCAGVTEVYLVATGGNPGLAVPNPNLALMASLGPCSALTASTNVVINELTTVAATSALAPYMTSLSAVGSGTGDAAALANAFTLSEQLVDTGGGATPGNGVPLGMSVPTSEINTLADILASCINSGGGSAGDKSNCGVLFAAATPSGSAAPTDGIQALVNLARNPTLNTATLYGLATPTAPFQPVLPQQPPTFAVALTPSYLLAGVSALSFGTVPLGVTTASQTVNLVNSTAGPVMLGGVSVVGAAAGDYAESTTCGATVAKGAACSVTLTFSPGAAGARNAALFVSVPNSPVTVALSGTGATPSTGPVTIAPASLTFYERGVPQTVTLTNNSPNPLAISAINVGSNWTETNNCGPVLSGNSLCTIAVTAGATAGQFNGSLTVVDGDTSDPQTVTLATDALYTQVYDFDYQQYGSSIPGVPVGMGMDHAAISLQGGVYWQTIQGYPIYTYSSVTAGPNATDFPNLGSTSGGGSDSCSIKSLTTCTLSFYFNPTALGLRYAKISTNEGENFLFKGTGLGMSGSFTVSTKYLSFATVPVGTSTISPLSITNTSTSAALSLQLTSSDAQYTVPGGTCIQIAPGATCVLSVKYTPVANSVNGGPYLNVVPAFGSSQVVNLEGTSTSSSPSTQGKVVFSNLAPGSTATQTVLSIMPNKDLASASLAGTGAPFSLLGSTDCMSGQATCVFTLQFAPTALGSFTDTLTVTDEVNGGISTIPVSGVGGVPVVSPSPTSLNFGTRTVGTTSTAQTITLTNTGTAPLTMAAFTFTGATSDYFQTNTCANPVAVNGSCTVSVTDTPSATGTRNATLTVTSNGAAVAISLTSVGN